MAGRKPKGDKPMEKLLNFKVSDELMEALEETKWTLRKSIAEVLREAVVEYMERNLPDETLIKVKEILKRGTRDKTNIRRKK